MEADTLKGIVYLVLTIAAIAAVAIGILAWKLDRTKKKLVRTELELAKVRRELADLKDKEEVEGMTDGELLDDVRSALGGTDGGGAEG